MGGKSSVQHQSHAEELTKLIRNYYFVTKGEVVQVKLKDVGQLLGEIVSRCPWYPEAGTLDIQDWINIGNSLHMSPRAPIRQLLLWQKCTEALEHIGTTKNLKTPSSAHESLKTEDEKIDRVPITTPDPYTLPPPYLQTTSEAATSLYPQLPMPEPVTQTSQTSQIYSEKQSSNTNEAQFDPCGAVRMGFQEEQKKGNLTGEELLEGLQAFPITERINDMGGREMNWSALPYSVLRELRTSIKETGFHSSYTRGLLEAMSNGYKLVPQDWKDLSRMLLTPAQYVVWESEYQREALIAGTASGGAYLPEQLFGSGQFATIEQQALGIPAVAYSAIVHCVNKAFKRVPESGKVTKSFIMTRQTATEPYTQFIDRLQEAIRRQVDNSEASVELLLKLAFENANADCRKVLQSIVARPDYNLADMLKACADVGTHAFQMDALAVALQKGQFHTPKGTCFNCKKAGHFKQQCRAPGGGAYKGTDSAGVSRSRPKTVCPKCKKGFHWANQCRSTNQGN
ncbi:endogenous retrovirus group K member 113 Gag polyprotein-like [Rhinatrema bivittatum]|uniref:endogenous retrovirus group K member 113 Gag polyprotein-like n=1 Tax=Rhinatrema bivittatum TaxID=194408 RepID=UPI00112BA111|nr:endogenous retrovirus group K member 113 Gag polyprotein-like [Rhinatrema bivittatum]